jgi:hypothetical protein
MTEQLTFWSEAHHANRLASQDCERVWMIRAATSCSHILPLLNDMLPAGSSGKTSPAFCQATEDEILEPSLGRWLNSGMGSLTECWTLSSSEHPSDGVACSLSDVLEAGNVPERFFLSEKACSGILRRAERRGKKLPEQLQRALEAVAAAE